MSNADVELLQRWRNGDTDAGEALFERYYSPIARFFRNKISADISDLVQETFAACVEGRDRLQIDGNFRAYIFSVARNILCAQLRSKYRGGAEVDFEHISVQDLRPGPGSLLAHRREQRLLLDALRRIPVNYQILLELRYWEQLRTAEIAEILDLPHATVRTRLRRARDLLNEAMAGLAQSKQELENTLANFDDWAKECRNLGNACEQPSGSY